jgi:hypothetical protein
MAFSAILKRPSVIVEQIIKVIIAYIVAFTLFFFSQLPLNVGHMWLMLRAGSSVVRAADS